VTREEILAKVAAGEIPVEEASELLEKADQAKKGSLYCKVSKKGGISVYGLQRMPVTLYPARRSTTSSAISAAGAKSSTSPSATSRVATWTSVRRFPTTGTLT
jgi:hypothetical protein